MNSFFSFFKTPNRSVILLFIVVLSAPATGYTELLDRIVAIVNNEIITLTELNEAGKEFIQKIQSSAPKEQLDEATKSANERILDQLISQRLVSQQAAIANISIKDEEFEKAYQHNIERMNLTRQELLVKLKEAGLSEETYRTNVRNQLLRDKLILYEVRSKIIITDEMINEYYTNEYANDSGGGGYYLLQMGFIWGKTEEIQTSQELLDADKARALQRAETVRKQVLEGESFKELAKQYSDFPSAPEGGDLGVFQEDELAGYMRDTVVALKPGEISPIIETPTGYQFFKLLSRTEGDVVYQAPLFEVKEEIRKTLFERKFKQEYSEWVEGIKEGAYIKKMLY